MDMCTYEKEMNYIPKLLEVLVHGAPAERHVASPVCVCVCVCVCVHACVRACVCACVCVYIHIHIYNV